MSETASDTENAFQTSTNDGDNKGCNWEKENSHHMKYYITLENLKAYGYQGLNINKISLY